ncbi:MAG: radical SAM protein [Alphaproteobacteria bacterium]
MTDAALARSRTLDPRKFRHPDVTADGERRGSVAFVGLHTLWFNTGTLCNITCRNCYIESSPKNDRLVYLTAGEVAAYLDEIEREALGTEEIGFTGGEPFMNPDIIAMIEDALSRGFRALVLTNAMRPMMKLAEPLLALKERFGTRLVVRVSVDHYSRALHELERGAHSWQRMFEGLAWLAENGFALNVAGRTCWDEAEADLRRGYRRLFAEHGIPVDAHDPVALVLFPEMDDHLDVPEITEKCWDILGVEPGSIMCATSRMVIKRKGAGRPVVVSCTLLPYDPQFQLGDTLASASRTVKLNHPHCAKFCVLGGGSCSKA